MHSLLIRQLRKCFPDGRPPDELKKFIVAVDTAYKEADTDRTMLEDSLQLSSSELFQTNSEMRAIFQSLPDMYFRLDSAGKIMDCKGGRAEEFVLPRIDLLGKRIQDVPSATVGAKFKEAIAEALRSREPVLIEYSLTPGEGKEYYEARILPVLKNQLVAIVRNITDGKLSALELARQRAYLRQVIDLNPHFIFAKDLEGRFMLVNKSIAEAYGTTADNMLGRRDEDFNPISEEAGQLRRDDREVIETLEDKFIAEEKVTDARGNVRWLQTIKRAIIGSDGKAHQVLGVSTDITQRLRAEESLRNRTNQILTHQAALYELTLLSHQELETALERIVSVASGVLEVDRVGIWLFDDSRTRIVCHCLHIGLERSKESEGTVLEAKDYPRYFSAMQQSRIVATHDARRDPRTSEFTKGYLEPLDIHSMLSVSIRLQGGLAGVVRHEQAARSREWTPEEQQFSVSIADLVSMALAGSKRRQLEEQLRQSQKMEAVGILAGGIAHDFNNLLTAILGYSEIMLMHLAAEDPMRGHVLEVRKAGERAAALTGQLLAFSRKQVLDPKVFDLKSTVENMHGMLRRIIGEDIDLVTHSDDDLGLVKADRMQIEQVLLNLVVNAREAMPHGGKLLIELRNDVLGDSETRRISGPVVRLSVTDNGQGMDAATRERIFDPFFTTKDQKGTGLGLSTVYGIVQQSGGHIEVDSDPGRGARFHVYLPHVDEVLADVIEPATATVSTPPKGSEVILLVEDEDQVRKLTRDILKTCGYTVLEAPHGGEALLLCERFQKTIDLLVTDIVMPHMTGCELYQRLVRLRPNMKVLYMSGYTDRGVVQHGTLKAGTDLIRKPFGPLEIAIRVREVLDVRQAEVACGTGTRT